MTTHAGKISQPARSAPSASKEFDQNMLRARAEEIVKPGRLLIDGKWVPSASGKTFPTFNPATKAKLTEVAEGDLEDADRAVKAARKAFESSSWRSWSPRERGRLLLRIADLISKNAEDFALLETLDTGKVISDSRTVDVQAAIEVLQYYAGWPDKIMGETVPVAGSFLNYTLREPVGVVAAIIPWNFPLTLATWKIGPAIACGCTMVLKPAEQTPLTALKLGEILLEAGVPDGVINIVTGYGPTAGRALACHMDVDKVAFTGSTEVGREILKAAGESNLKRVSLELGGKSPQIVFADADLSSAVQGCALGIYFNQGEICHAGSRLFLQSSVHDRFVDALVTVSKEKKVGNPLKSDSQMGALVSQEHYNRVLSYIGSGREQGAKLECGGAPAVVPECDGWFVQPTVFTQVKNEMRIAREEIFGPVVSVIRFDEVDEVVRAANATSYGLAAGVWTKDIQMAHRVAHALRAGTVWINAYSVVDCASSWGGFKQSGIGRELGMHALELYSEHKSIWVQL